MLDFFRSTVVQLCQTFFFIFHLLGSKLNTEYQLPGLPGRALKFVRCGWCRPTNYFKLGCNKSWILEANEKFLKESFLIFNQDEEKEGL